VSRRAEACFWCEAIGAHGRSIGVSCRSGTCVGAYILGVVLK
jgi:hypothetical protein